jgi:hypothetical protein
LAADSVAHLNPPPTYWLEVGIVGGVALGTLSGLGFHNLCESQHCTGAFVAGFVLGGAVGFTAGSLIGGQFRKHD